MGKLKKFNAQKLWFSALAILLLAGSSFIPLRLAMSRYQTPVPQAILVLGGNPSRMIFATKFWRSHPHLEIWVSGPDPNSEFYRQLLDKAAVPESNVHYDFCPTDTVTNFTCSVKIFANRNIRHLYLITSDYHMARSHAIARIVLGSHGIVVTPVPVLSKGKEKESKLRVLRDCLRSLLWIATGRTGASLNPRLHSEQSR